MQISMGHNSLVGRQAKGYQLSVAGTDPQKSCHEGLRTSARKMALKNTGCSLCNGASSLPWEQKAESRLERMMEGS